MGGNGMRVGARLSILTSNQFSSTSMKLFETIVAVWKNSDYFALAVQLVNEIGS